MPAGEAELVTKGNKRRQQYQNEAHPIPRSSSGHEVQKNARMFAFQRTKTSNRSIHQNRAASNTIDDVSFCVALEKRDRERKREDKKPGKNEEMKNGGKIKRKRKERGGKKEEGRKNRSSFRAGQPDDAQSGSSYFRRAAFRVLCAFTTVHLALNVDS